MAINNSRIYFSALFLLAGCKGTSAKFSSTRGVKPTDAITSEASTNTTRTVIAESEVTSDHFVIPKIASLTETLTVPAQPLQIESFVWTVPANSIVPITVEGSLQRSDTFTKFAPIKRTELVSRSVDFFITIDTSESFLKGSYNSRANQLVMALADQVYGENYDIRFILNGYLISNTAVTQVIVSKNSSSGLADFKTKLNDAITKILMDGSGSIERPFKSLALSVSSALRIDAVNGFFIITDNHNGLMKDNSPSPLVSFASNSADHYLYLSNVQLAPIENRVSLMGAMYRQTNGMCDDSAIPEVPPFNWILEKNSQFAAQSRGFQDITGAPYSGVNFMGDLCAANLDFSAIRTLGSNVINMRKTRYISNAEVPVFPGVDNQFNVKSTLAGNIVKNSLEQKRVVIAESAIDTVEYNLPNGYDTVSFIMLLPPADDSDVILKAPGYPDFTCARSDTFGVNDKCIFSGQRITLRDARTPYLAGANNLTFSVNYVNKVVGVNTFSYDSDFPMVNSSLKISKKSDGSAVSTSSINFSTNGKHLDINFSNFLQPGNYEVSFVKSIPSQFALKYPIASATANMVCLTSSTGVDVKNGSLIYPQENALPCTLSDDKLSVSLASARAENLNFVIAYLANTDPLSTLTTQKEPDAGSLKISLISITGEKQDLSQDQFQTNGRIISFNHGILILPGMQANWAYTSTPVKPSLVFNLSALPLAETPILVSYRKDESAPYKPWTSADFTIVGTQFTAKAMDYAGEVTVTYSSKSKKSDVTN